MPRLPDHFLEPFFRGVFVCEHLEMVHIADFCAGVGSGLSLIPLQLALSPTRVFPIGIEHPFDVSIDRAQHADVRMH
jgi:hypothetical protein